MDSKENNMTIDDMIKYLQRVACDSSPVGVQLLEVTEEDMMMYLPGDLWAKYKAATPEQQCRFLAALADELQETFETGDGYGFKKLLHDTLGYLEEEGGLDDLIRELEDKKEKDDGTET